jgi:hypothetical protein
MTARNPLVLVLVGLAPLALSPLVARAAEGQQQGRPAKACPLRPDADAHARLTFKMPKMTRPQAKIVSWGETQNNARQRDPYRVSLSGLHDGAKVTIRTQTQSADVEVPTACRDCGEVGRSRYSTAMRASVAKALRYDPLLEEVVTPPSPQQGVTIEKNQQLAVHSPALVQAVDRFGRRYRRTSLNVDGLQTETNTTYPNRYAVTYVKSGTLAPTYQPWATLKNVLITPSHYGPKGEPRVNVLGLAAFPAGARVTVTNIRMEGEGLEGHTVTLEHTNNSGSGRLTLPALQDDHLRVNVEFPGVANAANASSHTFFVRVPKASGHPAIKRRGVAYYPAPTE